MSTPSQNQNNNNDSSTGNFYFNNMHNASSSELVQPDGALANASSHGSTSLGWISQSSSTSDDHPPSVQMLEETPMSPGFNFGIENNVNSNDPSTDSLGSGSNSAHYIINLDVSRVDSGGDVEPNLEVGSVGNEPSHGPNCRCRRKRGAPDEASTSSHHLSHGNELQNHQVENCLCRVIPTQNNSSNGLNISSSSSSHGLNISGASSINGLNSSSPSSSNANANQLNQVKPGLRYGIMGEGSSMAESSNVMTNVESNSRNIRLRREQNHVDLHLSSFTAYIAAAAHPRVPLVISLPSQGIPSRIPNQPSTVFSPNTFSNLTAATIIANTSAGLVFTQTPRTYQQFPSSNWMNGPNFGQASSGNAIAGADGSETLLPEADVQHVSAYQSQENTLLPGSDGTAVGTHSNSAEQHTSSQNTASSSRNLPSTSVNPPARPAFFSEAMIDNAAGLPGILPTNISGAHPTIRDLMAFSIGDGRSVESFLREALRPRVQDRHDLAAAFRRARIMVAVRRALERLQQEALEEDDERQGFIVADTLASLVQTIVGAETIDMNIEQMGLDVNGMTYEELLDLREQVGSINNGLSQEAILARMKRYEYRTRREASPEDMDRCCICLDEYIDGQEMGGLNCGHKFHSDCIKTWLMQKNSCPICKRTGLTS